MLVRNEVNITTIKIDLHVHTLISKDAAAPLGAIIRNLKKVGLNAAALTDHNALALGAPCQEVGDIRLISGEEVMTSEGEIIGLFLRQAIPPELTPEDTIAAIRDQGGLTYLPHPFKNTGNRNWSEVNLKRILPGIDIIEVFNGRLLNTAANRQAAQLAKEVGALQGAGSDAHTPWEVGRTYVEMPDFDSPDSFLDSLRTARIFGQRPSLLGRILMNRFIRKGLRQLMLRWNRSNLPQGLWLPS